MPTSVAKFLPMLCWVHGCVNELGAPDETGPQERGRMREPGSDGENDVRRLEKRVAPRGACPGQIEPRNRGCPFRNHVVSSRGGHDGRVERFGQRNEFLARLVPEHAAAADEQGPLGRI